LAIIIFKQNFSIWRLIFSNKFFPFGDYYFQTKIFCIWRLLFSNKFFAFGDYYFQTNFLHLAINIFKQFFPFGDYYFSNKIFPFGD